MKRFLRIFLQIVISAEVTLQLLGLVLPDWSSRAASASAAGEVTILCVGDSHTYGAPLPPEESYPAQLQVLLDAHQDATYRVVNLGVPGMNSALMANRFEKNLARYRPGLVILWAGANNIWNESETEGWDQESAPDWPVRALLRLKLVRLVRFLGSGVARAGDGKAELLDWKRGRSASWRQGDEIIQMKGSGKQVSLSRVAKGVRKDLPRMIAFARAYGIPILLVTYPYEEFVWVNEPIRDVGRELDVEVLETIDARANATADGFTGDDLIVIAAGPHPKKVLHGYIASAMVPVVLRLLGTE